MITGQILNYQICIHVLFSQLLHTGPPQGGFAGPTIQGPMTFEPHEFFSHHTKYFEDTAKIREHIKF